MQIYVLKRGGYRRALIMSLLLFAALIVLAVLLFSNMEQRVDQEQATQLKTALRRAAVTCYAVEGRYPATLAYLTEQYGVVIDLEKFLVSYDVFAPNITPDISVTIIEGAAG